MLREKVELLEIEVRCDASAAADVRAAIGHLDHLGWIAGDAMLVASELVTNIVTRGGSAPERHIALTVTETRDALMISAHGPAGGGSSDSSQPSTLAPGGGLGLVVVDALAREWGTDRDRGYRAWAEIAKA